MQRGIDHEETRQEHVETTADGRVQGRGTNVVQQIHQKVADHPEDEEQIRPKRPEESLLKGKARLHLE